MKDITGALFNVTCVILCLVILSGGIYMCVSPNYTTWLEVLVLGVGILLNLLMSAYYISYGKKRSLLFVVLALILTWIVLSRAMSYLSVMG